MAGTARPSPAIHVLSPPPARTWMPGTRPGLTVMGRYVHDSFFASIFPHYPSWPGLSRPSTFFSAASKNVDARHKAGHDGDGWCVTCRVVRIHSKRARGTTVVKHRHGRACPGHPRSLSAASKDVDARHKAGHDGDGWCVTCRVVRIRSKRAHGTTVVKHRHGRACPGHPRSSAPPARTYPARGRA